MFDFFRRMILPIIIIALVGFLATIIFSWGADITSRSQYESANLAAVINGEEISWNTYQRVYDNLIRAEQQKSDDEITTAKRDELHNTAWAQIQYERLMLQEVVNNNITVSDNELYDFLKYSPPQEFQQAPAFQTNGQFDYQKYINALADPSFSPQLASLEPYFKTEIQKLKLQDLIIQAAHISENEVKDYFVSLNEKVKIGIINVKYANYSRPGPTSTEEEHLAYYNSHQDNYKVGERAVLKLVTIDKKPSQQDWDDGESQIKNIYDSVVAGADFAEFARMYSQDGSAANGGDLGWFKQGQMVKEFDNMVFSMKEGDISIPIKTQFGWHIIKHFGYKEDKESGKQAKASHILIKVVASQETLDIADNKLNQFRTDFTELGFEKAAEKNGLAPQQTIPFERGANMQYLARDISATDFAFTSELNALSMVFENASIQFVVQLVEKLPEGVAPYEVCQQRVTLDLLQEKVKTICVDTAAVIWSEIQNGASLEKAAKNHKFEYEESEEFARGGYVKGLNNAPEAIGAAFAMKNKDDLSGPVDYNQGTVIMKLLKKTPLDLNEFTAQKDSLANILLSNKQQELFGQWYENLIENSEIVNNVKNLRVENRNL